jgi:6-phosphogluconate dehydrogenase
MREIEENNMTNSETKERFEIGMVGLGVMGRNLVLNMADHGFAVSGYDKDASQVEALRLESKNGEVRGFHDVGEFVAALRRPRAVMMLVPAGAPVDSVIKDVLPRLDMGDLIIDAGNSYFKDTDARGKILTARGVQFLGVGVSGGEEGARHGPSIMPGGVPEAYERVRLVFEAVAAKAGPDSCVTYLGPGSAGHYVKMVHNGIEYAVMQILAEAYDLMKRGVDLDDNQLRDIFNDWNKGELNSYLVEITAGIFSKPDEKSGQRLVDEVLDEAKQNGTGMWTSQSAMELQTPTPTIDVAVAMRNMSALAKEREQAGAIYRRSPSRLTGDRNQFLAELARGLYAGMITIYAQGMALLAVGSKEYGYRLDLEAVARVWRGGCIIRAALLDDIRAAFRARNDLPNLLLDPNLSRKITENLESLRQVVRRAAALGIPAPGLMVSLGYIDAYSSAWLPANLIQAQRDCFGSHTYERIDTKGAFHSEWDK